MFEKILQKLDKVNEFIDNNFYNDYHNWILWYPIIFIVGIFTFFQLEYSNYIILFFLLFLLSISLLVSHNNKKIFLLLSVLLTILVGYIRTSIYVNNLKSPIVKYKMGYVKVYGVIEDVFYYQKNKTEKTRIIVKVDKIEKIKKLNSDERERNKYTPYFTKDGVMHNLPKYLRININNKKYIPKFGDYVELKTNLIPVQKQVFPGTYNTERNFYFQQIGGIGYNGYVINHYIPKNTSFFSKIRNKTYNIRENINDKIISITGNEIGPMLGSFITGIRGKINDYNYKTMTNAGLAHLIAISGLNMAIVMGLSFAITRRILVESEYLTLRFNIKIISAVIAIIFGFLYLSITGFPVSANRAYIMSTLFFIGIILEREIDTMRFLALSCIILLFKEPSLVFNSGFQLSFLAVIGLIAGFKILKDYKIKTFTTNIFLKPFYYIFATFMSTIFVEIAILPISIYSFNTYTPYNIITNMFAIPITSFITLPLITLSIFLIPFHLEKYLIKPASYSLNIVLNFSKYIVKLPYSSLIIASPPLISVLFMIFGVLWISIWEQKWRYFGIILFVIGLTLSFFKKTPDIIIDRNDKFIILISKDNELFISKNKNKYKISIIKKKLGYKDYKQLENYCKNNDENCNNFVNNINYIFRNKDYINNLIELNDKYPIFNNDYNVLLN